MEGIETPVETIEAEVFGKPVFKLIFSLGRVSNEGERNWWDHELCPGFGCILRVVRWRVGALPEEHYLLLGRVQIQETFLGSIGVDEVPGSTMEMSDEVACGIVPQFRERIGQVHQPRPTSTFNKGLMQKSSELVTLHSTCHFSHQTICLLSIPSDLLEKLPQ
jgi:hypothetical protein